MRADGTGDLLSFASTVFRWRFAGDLQSLFSDRIEQQDFDNFTDEEIALLESIPIIRDNFDPSLVSGTGSVELIGFVTLDSIPTEAQQALAKAGIPIQTLTDLVTVVQIDVKPSSVSNPINLRSRGVIPVGILTTDFFDAMLVEPGSILFGPTGTEAAPVHFAFEDVDEDGDGDLLLHFRADQVGIQCGDNFAQLTGKTVTEDPLRGADLVRTVGCK